VKLKFCRHERRKNRVRLLGQKSMNLKRRLTKP